MDAGVILDATFSRCVAPGPAKGGMSGVLAPVPSGILPLAGPDDLSGGSITRDSQSL